MNILIMGGNLGELDINPERDVEVKKLKHNMGGLSNWSSSSVCKTDTMKHCEFESHLSHKRAIGPTVRIRDCLSCGRGSIPLLPANSLTTDIVQNMDARREGKLRKKAPTEYETTPVFFSGSNPDASTKFGTIFEVLKIIGE